MEEGVGRAERAERRNVRVLKDNYIQEFSIVGKYDDPLDPAGYVLDLAAIHAREEAKRPYRIPNPFDLPTAALRPLYDTSNYGMLQLNNGLALAPQMG
ncbi:hypothetical protein ZWY2020_025120 [Hordeum vulgare]|nr:hypothetical protein ZWY2020_025120 [Hordeum vulgare]